jgi:hypothetical protein
VARFIYAGFRGGHVLGIRNATIVPFVARALASVGMTRAAVVRDTDPP